MRIFAQVEQTVADYDVLWVEVRSKQQQAADITSTVASRLAADRSHADERTATLTAQSKDPARPEIVRRLAQQELERLQERRFEPTEAEIAAFDTAVQDARDALRDARAVRQQLRELFAAADKELSALRGSTLGDQVRDIGLAERHIEGAQQAFDRFMQGSRPHPSTR